MEMCDLCSVILTLDVKCTEGGHLDVTSNHLTVIPPAYDKYEVGEELTNRDPKFGYPVGQGLLSVYYKMYRRLIWSFICS